MTPLPIDTTPLPTARLRKRLLCMVYEAMLLFGILFIATWAFSTLLQQRHALYLRDALQDWLFVVLGVYFCWIWTHGGQTLAMKTWRIKVLDRHGLALSQTLALKRFFLSGMWFAPPLALAWFIDLPVMTTLAAACIWVLLWAGASRFAPREQFWHDVWAGTQLVHEPMAD